MRIKTIVKVLAWLTLSFGLTLIAPTHALAHCDGLDGPVVRAAQRALDTRYVKSDVEFIHYVERGYEASTATAHGHFDQTGLPHTIGE